MWTVETVYFHLYQHTITKQDYKIPNVTTGGVLLKRNIILFLVSEVRRHLDSVNLPLTEFHSAK